MKYFFRITLLSSVLLTIVSCTGKETQSEPPSSPAAYRLNCINYNSSLTLSDWQVYSSQCEANPACPAGFEATVCSSKEYGCDNDTKKCGNSYCEEGENADNCAVDCKVERVPYNDTITNTTVVIDGISRTYWLYKPVCHDGSTARPLVIGLHGGGGTGEGFERALNLIVKADDLCFVALYPNGAPRPILGTPTPGIRQYWNSGDRTGTSWWDEYTKDIDDVSFIDQLIDIVKTTPGINIDTSRIYAAGFSNGGRMAHRLACSLSNNKLAAIAVFGAPLNPNPGALYGECAPAAGTVSVLHIHGLDDKYNPFDGGASCSGDGDSNVTSVADSMAAWRAINQCAHSYITTTYGDVVCKNYQGCSATSEVIICEVINGGHTIAGGYLFPIERGIGMGRVTDDIVSSDFIWAFLSSH